MAGAARQGDRGQIHCSPWTIANGSADVYINNRPAARLGDKTSLHLRPAGKICVPHTAAITQGAATVRINGKPAARIGSQLAGCTKVISGSTDVDIGGPSVGSGSGLAFQALAFAASFVQFDFAAIGEVAEAGGSLTDIAGAVVDNASFVNPLDSINGVLDSVAGVVTEGGVDLIAAPIEVAQDLAITDI